MDSNNTLTDRVRIFNRSGDAIAEFNASVERSWVLGAEGRASMTLASRKTEYVNSDTLKFGNFLLVENDVLQPWVGIIDMPRDWDARKVTVNAFTMERLFSFRRGSISRKLTGTSGSIFGEIVDTINAAENTIMQKGNLYVDNIRREETLTPGTLDRNLRQIKERSGNEYYFRPVVDKNRLTVFADWLQRMGNDTTAELVETPGGGNLERVTMKEDGFISNNAFGYGDGLTWLTKPNVTIFAPDSVAQYGLRQTSKEWNGVSQPATVEYNTSQYVAFYQQPRVMFDATALNKGDTFQYTRLGNTMRISLASIGFNGEQRGTDSTVRIMGMSYKPKAGQKIKLVLQEVIT